MTAVDIIMPVFNAGETLPTAISSILIQTHRDFRLIIIDDHSTDGCTETIADFDDDRIELIRLSRNQGPAHARNAGIARSTSALIAFADADDISVPERIATQVAYLQCHEDVDVLASQYIGRHSQRISNLPERNWEISAYLWFGNCIANPTVMMRRSSMQQTVGTEPFNTDFRESEDYELWQRLSLVHRLKFRTLPHALVVYDEEVDPTRAAQREELADRLRQNAFTSRPKRTPSPAQTWRWHILYGLARTRVFLRSRRPAP